MPLITRLFIKTGLVFLLFSLIAGVLIQVESVSIPNLQILFWHTLMLGWITQIIIGVSLWMFPGRKREETFSNQRWAWVAYVFLNSGLAFRIIAEPLLQLSASTIWKLLLIISAMLQFIAVVAYIIEIWPRAKGKKRHVKRTKE